MENVAEKNCRENPNTHFMFNKLFTENRDFLDNVGKYGRAGQTTTRVLHFSCWIPKATQTHSAYVIVIALP
jgi:hypothetical protein